MKCSNDADQVADAFLSHVNIVIIISKLLKRHSKAKHRAPAYFTGVASNQRGCPKNSPWEAQVRLPESERRQIRH